MEVLYKAAYSQRFGVNERYVMYIAYLLGCIKGMLFN